MDVVATKNERIMKGLEWWGAIAPSIIAVTLGVTATVKVNAAPQKVFDCSKFLARIALSDWLNLRPMHPYPFLVTVMRLHQAALPLDIDSQNDVRGIQMDYEVILIRHRFERG